MQKNEHLKDLHDKLRAKKKEIIKKVEPLRQKRAELLEKIAPLERELNDLNAKIKAAGASDLAVISSEISRLARAMGAKVLRAESAKG